MDVSQSVHILFIRPRPPPRANPVPTYIRNKEYNRERKCVHDNEVDRISPERAPVAPATGIRRGIPQFLSKPIDF